MRWVWGSLAEARRPAMPVTLFSVAVGLAMMTAATSARADEPLFGYVNTTDLLPRDKFQVEQWLTQRRGRAAGRYRRLETRTEIDYGLRSDVQLTAYLDASRTRANLDAAHGAARLRPAGKVSQGGPDGVTGEVIWRVASPYTAPAGLALLADATAGRGGGGLGLKAIAQKNLRDDTIVLAANLRVDLGRRETAFDPAGRPAGRRRVTPVEAAAGASYRFRANWSAAAELRVRTAYGPALRETAAFAGPSLHYGGQRWFLTFSALRRVHAGRGVRGRSPTVDGLAYAGRRARWDGLRVRLGRTF